MPIEKSQCVSTDVDLTVYPETALSALSSQITIGDLHGNALKFIYFLIREGVLDLKKDDFDTFVEIYNEKNLTSEHLRQFNSILLKASIKPAAENKNVVVRLVGDELADRGSNDYFTLKIFEKLKQGGVRVEALYSNHGVEFIEAMESGQISGFKSCIDDNGQTNSLNALKELIQNKLITEKEVLQLYRENYQPFFKALSYTLKNNEITIYTHAPVGWEVVESAAKKLGVEYDDSSAQKLAESIDNINKAFQEFVKINKVKELCENAKKDNDLKPSDPENAFALLMWHRPYHKRNPSAYQPARNFSHKSYQVNYVHGHDSQGNQLENVINLDNSLGKGSNRDKGTYTIFKADGTSQVLVDEIEKKAEKDEEKAIPEITFELTHRRRDPTHNKPISIQLNEWLNDTHNTQAYCILKNADRDSIVSKTQELQNALNRPSVTKILSQPPSSIPLQLVSNQTRLSHHQLYEDNSSAITQFGLIEKPLDKGSISSRLLLPSSVCLTKSDGDINLDEFSRLLMIIDQQVKQGIRACGETDMSEINLTLPIKNAISLSLYEIAYLHYCQEKSYSCSCINGVTEAPIEKPQLPPEISLSLASLNKGKIDDLSEQQEKFKDPPSNEATFSATS